MSDAPKIVHDRLQAARPVDTHPDADVLTAFAEQALSGVEREAVMRHLARCGDCREVVALSLPPQESVAQPQALAEKASPRHTPDRRLSWLAWPNLRWAALAASVVVVGSVLLLHPGRQQNPAIGTEESAKGSFPAPAANTKNDAAVAAPEPLPSAQSPQELVANRMPVEHDKSARSLNRMEAASPDRLTDSRKLDTLEAKASKTRDTDQPTMQMPAVAMAPRSPMASEKRATSASEQVGVGGAAVEVQSSTGAVGQVMARNDAPAPPIAKAKEAIKEEAGLKGQMEIVEGETKSTAAFAASDSSLARQKQFSKLAKDATTPQWNLAKGRLLRSQDAGKSWRPVLQPQPPLLSFAARGQEVWAGGHDGMLFHSMDAGQNWTMIQPATKAAALTGDIVAVEVRSATEIFLTTNTGESWTTTDAGTTWEKK